MHARRSRLDASTSLLSVTGEGRKEMINKLAARVQSIDWVQEVEILSQTSSDPSLEASSSSGPDAKILEKLDSLRGRRFTEELEHSLEFRNPNSTAHLCDILRIPVSQRPSMLHGLFGIKYEPKDFSKNLRKRQSAEWAYESVKKGVNYFKEGKIQAALQFLNTALKIDPENVEALVARGALYANNRGYLKAIEDFEKALSINPSHKNGCKYLCETLLTLGQEHEEKKDYDSALEAYTKAYETNPESMEAMEAKYNIEKKREEEMNALSDSRRSPSQSASRSPRPHASSIDLNDTRKKLELLIRDESPLRSTAKSYPSEPAVVIASSSKPMAGAFDLLGMHSKSLEKSPRERSRSSSKSKHHSRSRSPSSASILARRHRSPSRSKSRSPKRARGNEDAIPGLSINTKRSRSKERFSRGDPYSHSPGWNGQGGNNRSFRQKNERSFNSQRSSYPFHSKYSGSNHRSYGSPSRGGYRYRGPDPPRFKGGGRVKFYEKHLNMDEEDRKREEAMLSALAASKNTAPKERSSAVPAAVPSTSAVRDDPNPKPSVEDFEDFLKKLREKKRQNVD